MIGDNIRKQRKKLNYTQTELSKIAGVKQSTISAIENGVNKPEIETIMLLASALHCATSELLGEEMPEVKADLTDMERRVLAAWRGAEQAFKEEALAMLERHQIKGKEAAAS